MFFGELVRGKKFVFSVLLHPNSGKIFRTFRCSVGVDGLVFENGFGWSWYGAQTQLASISGIYFGPLSSAAALQFGRPIGWSHIIRLAHRTSWRFWQGGTVTFM